MTDKNSGKTDMEENTTYGVSQKAGVKTTTVAPTLNPADQEAKVKEFGLLPDMKATEEFLMENPGFINETTALALLKWSSRLSEQRESEFNLVSTQCLYVLYLLDLARQVDIDPIYCVTPFFARISEPEFYEMFEKEIIPFRERLQNSPWDQVFDDVLKGISSDDGSSLSGSSSSEDVAGNLDPIEMYKNLPPNLQQCIDNEDIEALEAALNDLPEDVADTYMAQFLEAGLFVPIETKGSAASGSEEEKELGIEDLSAGEDGDTSQ